MPELTEAQARRICEAVYVPPDLKIVRYRAPGAPDKWPDIPHEGVDYGEERRGYLKQYVPYWRIVQRAAAEGGEK